MKGVLVRPRDVKKTRQGDVTKAVVKSKNCVRATRVTREAPDDRFVITRRPHSPSNPYGTRSLALSSSNSAVTPVETPAWSMRVSFGISDTPEIDPRRDGDGR